MKMAGPTSGWASIRLSWMSRASNGWPVSIRRHTVFTLAITALTASREFRRLISSRVFPDWNLYLVPPGRTGLEVLAGPPAPSCTQAGQVIRRG